jgi:flagellar biogenesis protein FliO
MDLNRMILIFAILIVIIWMLMRARTEMLEVKKEKTIKAVMKFTK